MRYVSKSIGLERLRISCTAFVCLFIYLLDVLFSPVSSEWSKFQLLGPPVRHNSKPKLTITSTINNLFALSEQCSVNPTVTDFLNCPHSFDLIEGDPLSYQQYCFEISTLSNSDKKVLNIEI